MGLHVSDHEEESSPIHLQHGKIYRKRRLQIESSSQEEVDYSGYRLECEQEIESGIECPFHSKCAPTEAQAAVISAEIFANSDTQESKYLL